MNSTTTIIGVIALLLFVLPFIFATLKSKNGSKQILLDLSEFAKKNDSKISESDHWNNKAIGIDKENHKLLFIKKVNSGYLEKQIRLSEIQKCMVSTINKQVDNKDGIHKMVERLDLSFTFKDKNKLPVKLEFYNADIDSFTINGEHQLSEKWLKLVNAEIGILTAKK